MYKRRAIKLKNDLNILEKYEALDLDVSDEI